MNPNDPNYRDSDNIVDNMVNTLIDSSQSQDATKFYGTLAVAGAAVLGGALYYYMNSGSSKKAQPSSIIDFKNQTREVKVC